MQQIDGALRVLDTFASVGATHFDLTHTSIDGEKRGFWPTQSLAQLKNSMPKLFPGAAERKNNMIIRPVSDRVHFVQLTTWTGQHSAARNQPRQSPGVGCCIRHRQ